MQIFGILFAWCLVCCDSGLDSSCSCHWKCLRDHGYIHLLCNRIWQGCGTNFRKFFFIIFIYLVFTLGSTKIDTLYVTLIVFEIFFSWTPLKAMSFRMWSGKPVGLKYSINKAVYSIDIYFLVLFCIFLKVFCPKKGF